MKGAEWYEVTRLTAGRHVNDDTSLFDVPRRIPELDLQAAWFSGDFGRRFRTVDGNSVEIVQFGVWNREAGPDFTETAISIDGEPPVRGPISPANTCKCAMICDSNSVFIWQLLFKQ